MRSTGRRRSALVGMTARLALLVTGLAGLLAAGVFVLVERELAAGQARELARDAAALAALHEARDLPALREAIGRPSAGGQVIVLTDAEGRVLGGTLPAWPEGVARSPGTLSFSGPAPGGGTADYRGLAGVLPGGLPLLVARPTAEADALLARLGWTLALGLAAVAAAGSALGWLFSRRILRRLDAMNALCLGVEGGRLDARLTPGGDDEFGRLERHVNRMLDRLAALQRATRALSDHIAHELRTPLNRIQQRILRLAGTAAPEETAPLIEEIGQTIAVFDALLDIAAAEADAGNPMGLAPVDLAQVAADMAELYEAAASARGLTLEAEAGAPALLLGDRNLVARVVANLLDNAVKYTPPGGAVRLAVIPGPRHLLRVRDTGPGIPAELRAAMPGRFVRHTAAGAAPGHGLGLALVQAIVLRHGGRMTLAEAPGGGLEIAVLWPALGPASGAGAGPITNAVIGEAAH
jgi:signal transduction histidine kinase